MKFELYRDKSRQWRARIRAGNGRIVWCTSESYRRRRSAFHALDLLLDAAATGEISGQR